MQSAAPSLCSNFFPIEFEAWRPGLAPQALCIHLLLAVLRKHRRAENDPTLDVLPVEKHATLLSLFSFLVKLYENRRAPFF